MTAFETITTVQNGIALLMFGVVIILTLKKKRK